LVVDCAVEMNARRREETAKEREELMAHIAESRRAEDERTAAMRDQNSAYRADLLGQIDYNRRQRALAADEQARTVTQPGSTHANAHTRLTGAFFRDYPGEPVPETRKVKPIWILLKQETVSGSGISWAIYKSAHRSRQITTPAPHHLVFYKPDALPAAEPTVSKH